MPMICFRLVPFLKAIIGSVLKVSLQLLSACNMCQCFIISFKFGNVVVTLSQHPEKSGIVETVH